MLSVLHILVTSILFATVLYRRLSIYNVCVLLYYLGMNLIHTVSDCNGEAYIDQKQHVFSVLLLSNWQHTYLYITCDLFFGGIDDVYDVV